MEQQNTRKPVFKVAIIGPSRVGKTSLITAILTEGKELLRGKAVELVPGNNKTDKLISDYLNDLQGSLSGNQFNPGGLAGNLHERYFDLELRLNQNKELGICWSILDFPGGWMEPGERDTAKWDQVENWLRESSVLLIPIDAAVVMEADTTEKKRKRADILKLAQVKAAAETWAKARCQTNEPALLILSPLKCESYFSDNGGTPFRNRTDEELWHSVRDQNLYGTMIETVIKEFEACSNSPHLIIQYQPIDTIGCVELATADWEDDFTATYLVRKNIHGKRGCITPLGASGILISICKQLMGTRVKKADEHATKAYQDAHANHNIFVAFWMSITGQQQALDEKAKKLAKESDILVEGLDFLNQLPLGNRVKVISDECFAEVN